MMRWTSPVGSFLVQFTDAGVGHVHMDDGTPAELVTSDQASMLDAFVRGEAVSIDFDLSSVHSPLQQLVLAKLLEIPRGEVRSYAWVAREIGQPRAIRAVASAVARNPIPLFVPCHRVVRSDGLIGEFSLGGPEMKRRILSFEGLDVEDVERLARRGVRFVADARTRTAHLVTCRQVPVAGDESRVELRAVDGAYQPCARCKPYATGADIVDVRTVASKS